jgi:hypothetical protein
VPAKTVSGTGRYFIDLLLKKLEKSAAYLGKKAMIPREGVALFCLFFEYFEFPRKNDTPIARKTLISSKV